MPRPQHSMRERVRAIRVVMGYSFRADAPRASGVLALQVVGAANTTLAGVWVKLLIDGVRAHLNAQTLAGVIGLTSFALVGLLLSAGAVRMMMVLREKTVHLMEADLLTLAARSPGPDLQENHTHLEPLQLWQGATLRVRTAGGWS